MMVGGGVLGKRWGSEHIFIFLSGLQGANAMAIIGQGIAMATAELGSREKGIVLFTMWRNELGREEKKHSCRMTCYQSGRL